MLRGRLRETCRFSGSIFPNPKAEGARHAISAWILPLRERVTVIYLRHHAIGRRGLCILYSRLVFSLPPPLPRTVFSAEGKRQSAG
jgi:hypothetical protein